MDFVVVVNVDVFVDVGIVVYDDVLFEDGFVVNLGKMLD